jgi:cell wall-associated NlpC family hydrolase
VRLPNNDIGRIARAAVTPNEVIQPLIVAKPKDAPPVILAKPQSKPILPGTPNKQPPSPAIPPQKSSPPLPTLQEMTPQRQDIVTTAQRFLGVRYVWGGTTTRGFDCSGLTYLVYKLNGIELPRLSTNQFDQTLGKKIVKTQLAPGDLVFFQTISKGASHVGIYIGNQQFIHASPTYGVTIGSFDDAYFSTRYIGARTIFPLS